MKKIIEFMWIAILSIAGFVIVGTVVVFFMNQGISGANERLEVREAERASIEDGWNAAHESRTIITLHIEIVEFDGTDGVIEWYESNGTEGRTYFEITEDGNISFLAQKSEFPKVVNSYPMYFRQAIEAEIE